MHPAFFSLIMITAHVSVPVDCRPKLQHHHHHHHHQTGRFNSIPADLAAGSEPTRSARKGSLRGLLVIVPVRTAASNFVSVFDLRRKRFLCMDFQGELYKSRQRDRLDCLFHRVWSDEANHHDVLHSPGGYWLLRLGGRDLQVVQQEPAEVSPALVERFPRPPVKRRRRSQEVNPSDPLRSESSPSHPAKDADQREQEQTGSVSKETIASVDDPLWVLRPNGHGSPVKTNIAERAEHE